MATEPSPFPLAVVHRSQELYKGKQFSFVLEDVTLPNKNRAAHAHVRHPGSAAIVPIDDSGRIVLIRQYRHAVNSMMLEIPAGTMDPGESPLNCARRELEEETGIIAREFVDLGPIHILPSYSDEMIHIFLARDLAETEQNLDPDEIIQVLRYPVELVLQSINDGSISEALTIVSVFKAKIYLEREG